MSKKIKIEVDCNRILGIIDHIWTSIGYDEINFTYTPRGRKIYREIKKIEDGPFYVRNHNTFTSGNGLSSPSAGSTNVYREDKKGNPVYDWSLLDQIYDTYVAYNCRPIIELGFMPDSLSSGPKEGYTRKPTIPTEKCAFPPKDYKKWLKLVYETVTHCVRRYGKEEIKKWYWELWNESDIFYWEGSEEEYFKLYDYSVQGAKEAFHEVKIGGPAIAHDPRFLDKFLSHCKEGKNYVTGEKGTQLDFISFHTKGTQWPKNREEKLQPSLKKMMNSLENYRKVISRYPEFSNLICLFDECDIDVGTILGIYDNPYYEFRNTEYYPVFLCRLAKALLDFQAHYNFNPLLFTTWAFYYEGKRYFEGNRTLFTNENIKKPVYNAFVMLSKLGKTRLALTSSCIDENVSYPNYDFPVDGLATQKDNSSVEIMFWNFDENPKAKGEKDVTLEVNNIPFDTETVQMEHYRIDEEYSNSYTAWKNVGSPQDSTQEWLQTIKRKENLEQIEFVRNWGLERTTFRKEFRLPIPSVSLVILKPGTY